MTHPSQLMGQRRYVYNSKQRPIQLYIDGKLTAEYAYNGFGERIKKTVYNQKKPETTYFLYEGQRIVSEADASGDITSQYIYHQNRAVIKLEGTEPYYLHSDHLGTPQLATNNRQQAVWQAEYNPFGRAHIKQAYITLNLRFQGQYADHESGTYYNYFRDYDPETGRYLSSDPLGLGGGINTYAYVNSNPLMNTDPLGLATIQYVLIDGGLNGDAAGSDILHWAAIITPEAGDAFTSSIIFDPNGTLSGDLRNMGLGDIQAHYGNDNILYVADAVQVDATDEYSDPALLYYVLSGESPELSFCPSPEPFVLTDVLPPVTVPFMPNHSGTSLYPGENLTISPNFFIGGDTQEFELSNGQFVQFTPDSGSVQPEDVTAATATPENCAAVFDSYEDRAELILANAGTDGRDRNKAINSAYAQLALENNNFKWAGLGAVASFNVGCALDLIEVRKGQVLPPLFADLEVVENALEQGNQTLFLDIYTWHLIQLENPEAIQSCAVTDDFPVNSFVREGFANTAGNEEQQWESLTQLAVHEQVNILGEAIYRDPALQTQLDRNELLGEFPYTSPAQANLSANCEETRDDRQNVFSASTPFFTRDRLWDDDLRMNWIAGTDSSGNATSDSYAGNIAAHWRGTYTPRESIINAGIPITESERQQTLRNILQQESAGQNTISGSLQ